MQDNYEEQQAEALSAAIDALNRGELPDRPAAGVEELVDIAKAVKDAGLPADAPPQAVLDNIVRQASNTLVREKQKKRQSWRWAGAAGAAVAVLVAAMLQFMPPVTPERELAKAPPAPAAEQPQPPAVVPSPQVAALPPAIIEPPPAVTTSPASGHADAAAPAELVTLVEPESPVPAAADTMLALADLTADAVTIDAASKTIRQIYRQGTADEIIVTQAPKQQSMAAPPRPPQTKMRTAALLPGESTHAASKPPDKNKVTVIVNDLEVTLEGAATEEELLSLAERLVEIHVAK
ncbi:hypothetical protein [Sporomusa sp. GT1]|uniref:hypothetical protein n=1 Tax=Sporomusa sp. GT1 TaxID=1534747 RepID=UPI00166EC69C|nr:hypothetical protein [Sporomusa sp. GT1]